MVMSFQSVSVVLVSMAQSTEGLRGMGAIHPVVRLVR